MYNFLRFLLHCLKGNFQYAFGLSDKSNRIFAWFKHFFYATFYFKKGNDQAVVCKLEGDNMGRYAFTLLNTFYIAGIDVFLIPDRNFYAKARGLYIFRLFDFLHIGYYRSAKQLSRYKEVYGLKMRTDFQFSFACKKQFVVDYDAFQAAPNKHLVPFGFHPLLHIENHIKSEKQLNAHIERNRYSKTIPIFFGGQVFHQDYLDLNRTFPNLINRSAFFNTIMDHYGKDLAGLSKIHVYDRIKVDIPRSEWLSYLGKAKFFLAAPGFEMPFCHNLIEAMAMGAIPILQYGSMLRPALEDGKNALFFNTKSELLGAIEKAIHMPEIEREQMEKSVVKYYQEYLNPASFVMKLRNSAKDVIGISLIAGALSIKEL